MSNISIRNIFFSNAIDTGEKIDSHSEEIIKEIYTCYKKIMMQCLMLHQLLFVVPNNVVVVLSFTVPIGTCVGPK